MSVVQERIARTLPTVRKFKCLPSECLQKKKKEIQSPTILSLLFFSKHRFQSTYLWYYVRLIAPFFSRFFSSMHCYHRTIFFFLTHSFQSWIMVISQLMETTDNHIHIHWQENEHKRLLSVTVRQIWCQIKN